MAGKANVDNYGDALRNILSSVADAQGVPGADIPALLKLQFAVIGMIQKGPSIPGQQGQQGQQQQPGQPGQQQGMAGQPNPSGQPNPMGGTVAGGGAMNPQQVSPGLGMMSGHTAQMQNNPDELRRMLQQQLAG